MSTYLVAFVVSKFGYITVAPRPNNVQVRFWAKNASLDQTAYAQEIGPKFLEFFENYFDIPFPMPKQVKYRSTISKYVVSVMPQRQFSEFSRDEIP